MPCPVTSTACRPAAGRRGYRCGADRPPSRHDDDRTAAALAHPRTYRSKAARCGLPNQRGSMPVACIARIAQWRVRYRAQRGMISGCRPEDRDHHGPTRLRDRSAATHPINGPQKGEDVCPVEQIGIISKGELVFGSRAAPPGQAPTVRHRGCPATPPPANHGSTQPDPAPRQSPVPIFRPGRIRSLACPIN